MKPSAASRLVTSAMWLVRPHHSWMTTTPGPAPDSGSARYPWAVRPLLGKVTFCRGLSTVGVISPGLVHHAGRGHLEVLPHLPAPLLGQVGLVDRDAHAAQPRVALERPDGERAVPHPQARVPPLVRVGLRPAPVLLEEHEQALLGGAEVLLGVEGAQDRVVGDLLVEAV